MLKFEQYEDTNLLECTLDGPLTRADFDALTAKADEMIEQFGQLRFLEVIEKIGKIQPSALWADFKWGPKHIKSFSHVAVVADQKWIEWMIVPFRKFMSCEVRVFHLDELEDARQWLLAAETSGD